MVLRDTLKATLGLIDALPFPYILLLFFVHLAFYLFEREPNHPKQFVKLINWPKLTVFRYENTLKL